MPCIKKTKKSDVLQTLNVLFKITHASSHLKTIHKNYY